MNVNGVLEKAVQERINELVIILRKANVAYRNGAGEIMPDEIYDSLEDELRTLDPDNDFFQEIGGEVIDESRKEKLPIDMASMHKVKTMEEIRKWYKSKGIPLTTEMVLIMKYDGASLAVKEATNSAWTRGKNGIGQRSDAHLKEMNRKQITTEKDVFTFGEAIIPRKIFLDKYAEDYANPRNLVSGKLNDKIPNEEILSDSHYVAYGVVGKDFDTKVDMLEYLNANQKHKVPYKVVTLADLSEEYLKDLFFEWITLYEIDGIIIEINDRNFAESLGRETTKNNPCWARAYKGAFEEVKETHIVDLEYEVSKKGFVKPVGVVEPVELDGATVTRVTLYNAQYVKELDLGIGSIIKLKRSGMVIPKLVDVVKATGFVMPVIEGTDLEWNDSGVELVCTSVTPQQRYRQLVSFFKILEVENMGEGIIKQFFDAGYDTAKKILSMRREDMLLLEKFGVRKSDIVVTEINNKRNVTLAKLQHASGFFENLGSKKLLLLEDLYETYKPIGASLFLDNEQKTSLMSEIITREGFSEISASNYINGLPQYMEFEKDLKGLVYITLTPTKKASSSELSGMAFVFTGFRDKSLENEIYELGGEVRTSISNKIKYLVVKDLNSSSSKITKAKSMGIELLEIEDLKDLIYKSKKKSENEETNRRRNP